jgi:DNA-binding MurR/RpiR family transcriptional regulator
MSAIERRIADFMLENAHLLRDYSSQQLADALQISQSSVVKFSQKLGFKGYPDLKYSVGEAVARNGDTQVKTTARATRAAARESIAETLWESKSRAEEETRLINAPEKLAEIAALLGRASKVYCIGIGDDGIAAQVFTQRLALLGALAVYHVDPVAMTASIGSAGRGDVLVVFSEQGQYPPLNHLCRQFRERHGTVISVTRHPSNPLRARRCRLAGVGARRALARPGAAISIRPAAPAGPGVPVDVRRRSARAVEHQPRARAAPAGPEALSETQARLPGAFAAGGALDSRSIRVQGRTIWVRLSSSALFIRAAACSRRIALAAISAMG